MPQAEQCPDPDPKTHQDHDEVHEIDHQAHDRSLARLQSGWSTRALSNSDGCDRFVSDRTRRQGGQDHLIASFSMAVVSLKCVDDIVTVALSTIGVVRMAPRWLVQDETVKSGVEKIEEIKDVHGFRDLR